MSSVNAGYNSSLYYQLGSQNGTTTGSTSGTQSLASLLNGDNSDSSNSSSDLFGSSYLLNLSPAAQSYLNGNASSSSSTATSGTASFTLTKSEQTTLDGILQKYKDAPYTQDTFNQIQDDLASAGLSTSQLSKIDSVKSFNPTVALVDALNGTNFDPTSGVGGTTDEQNKSTNFINSVQAQWKAISTTAGKTTSADAVTATSSTGA